MKDKTKIPPIKTEKETVKKFNKWLGWIVNKDTNETIII